jgi:hypothetical protein
MHPFKLLPKQEQLDTIAYSWFGSASLNPIHAIGCHINVDESKVDKFLKEYFACDSTQLDELLIAHKQYKEDNCI